jgi:hypothetical protein
MKWTKVRAGLYRSGKYELRQARWRASNDGWMITTDDESFHDSARLLVKAKRRCEMHAADEIKKEEQRLGPDFGTRLFNAHAKVAATAPKTTEPVIPKVDLLNASAQLFCETLFLAAKIGVTDAMQKVTRDDHALATLLCKPKCYRYEHVCMLHEAYEAGQTFMELQGQPTNMKWDKS